MDSSTFAPDKPAALTYTVRETAAVIGVSIPTIYRLILRGDLRPLPKLRHKFIPKTQVHDFVGSSSAGEGIRISR